MNFKIENLVTMSYFTQNWNCIDLLAEKPDQESDCSHGSPFRSDGFNYFPGFGSGLFWFHPDWFKCEVLTVKYRVYSVEEPSEQIGVTLLNPQALRRNRQPILNRQWWIATQCFLIVDLFKCLLCTFLLLELLAFLLCGVYPFKC